MDNLGRMFRPLGVELQRGDDYARGGANTPSSSSKNHRRDAVVEDRDVVPPGWTSYLSSLSPPHLGMPPSALYCIGAMILLSTFAASTMSFVARSRRIRRRQVAFAMDANEAEIVEFYEREEMMERGGTSPAKKGRGEGEGEGDDYDEWRRLLFVEMRCQGDDGGGPRDADRLDPSSAGGTPREHPYRRVTSDDDSLLGHSRLHPASERVRQHGGCDLYYSRVLGQLLDYEDEDVGDGTRPLADEGGREIKDEELRIYRDAQCDDDVNSIHHNVRDCQNAVSETFSSLTCDAYDGGAMDSDGAGELRCDQVDPTAVVETMQHQEQSAAMVDCELLKRTQTAEEEYEQGQDYRSQSPLSLSSSLSSLTSEGFDIETPSPSRRMCVQNNNATDSSCADTSLVMSNGEGQVSNRPSVTPDAANVASATCDTSPRSNLRNDRNHRTAPRGEQELPSRRHVSFSPKVEICSIPPAPAATYQRRADELSFEGYLYIMLIALAIAIAVFSLFPAHPSLSPLHFTARGDIFQFTVNLLKSQWDVEL